MQFETRLAHGPSNTCMYVLYMYAVVMAVIGIPTPD